jgi:hypothetical protein
VCTTQLDFLPVNPFNAHIQFRNFERMTESTNPGESPVNDGGGNASTTTEEPSAEAAAEPSRPSRDYSIPSDPPDNQGGGW